MCLTPSFLYGLSFTHAILLQLSADIVLKNNENKWCILHQLITVWDQCLSPVILMEIWRIRIWWWTFLLSVTLSSRQISSARWIVPSRQFLPNYILFKNFSPQIAVPSSMYFTSPRRTLMMVVFLVVVRWIIQNLCISTLICASYLLGAKWAVS